MEFVKGKLYISNDKKYEGCVFEFEEEENEGFVFNVIKGDENCGFNGIGFRKEFANTFMKPLIPTKDDVNECEPCPENGYDEINKSFHYNQGIEAIEYIESHNMNFNEGNVIKYVTRAKYKGTYIKDLEKARYYLDRLIKKGENND